MHSYVPGAIRKARAIRSMSADVQDIARHTTALMPWRDNTPYAAGEGVVHGGRYWRCTIPHTSSASSAWEPGMAPSLWQEIGNPAEEWPAWMPHTVYNSGDKVTWEGKRYICTQSNMTHSPGDYPAGWEEAAA